MQNCGHRKGLHNALTKQCPTNEEQDGTYLNSVYEMPDKDARIAELENMLARICANPMVQDTIEADPRTNYLIRDARELLKGN